MNTLKGCFPEPKSVPKRNFIKENMVHLKQMQGLIKNVNKLTRSQSQLVKQKSNHPLRKPLSQPKDIFKKGYREANPIGKQKPVSISLTENKATNFTKNISDEKTAFGGNDKSKSSTNEKPRPSRVNKNVFNKAVRKGFCDVSPVTAIEHAKTTPLTRVKSKEIGIQTDPWIQPMELISVATKQKSPQKDSPSPIRHKFRIHGDGDSARKSEIINSLTRQHQLEKKSDSVKEVPSPKRNAARGTNDPNVPPATYQRGVVPKYLKERKEELNKKAKGSGDEKCPSGHVILPENERKETLRMLRQSYAELITELNLLPVRSDTLKTRNRKIEIENQLKKLDEGIKVFTRPKVFVKIDV